MIGKNEKAENDSTNATHVDIISEKRKLLRDTSAKVQEEVRLCFEQLAKVLRTREKQLLRQVQAAHDRRLTIVWSDQDLPPSVPSIKVNLSRQRDLRDSILRFGELVSSDGSDIVVSDAEPYRIEEYAEADGDRIGFHEFIEIDNDESNVVATERSESSPESPYELSFDTSSEADITVENEITVLANHNRSTSSDGLGERLDSPLSRIPDVEEKNSASTESKFQEDSSRDTDGVFTRSGGVFDDADGVNCTLPERKEEPIVENSDSLGGENDRRMLKKEKEELQRSTDFGSPTEILEKRGEALASKKAQDCDEHPKQIQQWLRQILVETETEPTIHEIEQFAEISTSRFKEFQFPLET